MKFHLDFLLQASGGKLVSDPVKEFSTYSVDNRSDDVAGSFFIPLVGEAHDAHKFVKAAIDAGAGGAIVHQWDPHWDSYKDKVSFIEVDDTLKALQKISKAWRQQFKGKVIGLTGSNGKTTTKDFLGQLLASFGSTNISQGSFNNHWGVPFTLLNCDLETQFCVTEMGMNHAGEISHLMTMADPDLVAVTNVGTAHMGNFENGVEGVAAAKEEIYESSKARAQLIFNIDNDWTRKMYQKYMDRPSYTFSTHNFSADVYFKKKSNTEKGMMIEGQIGGEMGKTEVFFWGDQNIENLAAAVSLAYIAGCSPKKLWDCLANCQSGWGRNQWLQLNSGGEVLFDGYNANPDSFAQLILNISERVNSNSESIGVFGEMLELGEKASQEHYKLGQKLSQLSWKKCFFVGVSAEDFKRGWEENSEASELQVFNSFEESGGLGLLDMDSKDRLFVVKGSRGGALERYILPLKPIGFKPLK